MPKSNTHKGVENKAAFQAHVERSRSGAAGIWDSEKVPLSGRLKRKRVSTRLASKRAAISDQR